jgi:hypothetical protein
VTEKGKSRKFTKQQFMKSAQFTQVQKDALRALMRDDQACAIDEAKRLIKQYANRKVD